MARLNDNCERCGMKDICMCEECKHFLYCNRTRPVGSFVFEDVDNSDEWDENDNDWYLGDMHL